MLFATFRVPRPTRAPLPPKLGSRHAPRLWEARLVAASVERQDQLIFALLGGTVAHLGARCRLWDTHTGLCGCGAPEALMGRKRTVVEMGANDGLHMSNSYFFSKTLGWRALLIEGTGGSPSTGPRPSASTRSWATPSTFRPTAARPSSPFTDRAIPKSTTPRSTGRRG